MMHGLGCRCFFKFPRDQIVRKDVFQQLPEIRVVVVADNLHQLGEHLFDIVPGGGEVMGQIDFMFEAETHAMNGDLQMIAIVVDESADEDNIITVESINRIFKVIPPLADKVSGPI